MSQIMICSFSLFLPTKGLSSLHFWRTTLWAVAVLLDVVCNIVNVWSYSHLSSKFWLRNALVIWYGDPLWQVAFYCFFLSVLMFLLKLDSFLWGHSLFWDISTLLLNLHMDNFIHSLYCTLEFIFHFNMVFRSCVDMLQVYVSSNTESSYLEPFLAYGTCIKFHFNLCQARHWFPFLWVGCCRIIQNSQCHAFINL